VFLTYVRVPGTGRSATSYPPRQPVRLSGLDDEAELTANANLNLSLRSRVIEDYPVP
jgi:hypothetical protein